MIYQSVLYRKHKVFVTGSIVSYLKNIWITQETWHTFFFFLTYLMRYVTDKSYEMLQFGIL